MARDEIRSPPIFTCLSSAFPPLSSPLRPRAIISRCQLFHTARPEAIYGPAPHPREKPHKSISTFPVDVRHVPDASRSRPQPAEARVLPTRFRALYADPQPCVCVLYARSDEPPAQITRSTHASTCPPRASPRQPGLLHLQLLPASAPGALISLGRLSFTSAAIQRSWRRHLGSTLMFSLTTSIALYCDHYNLKTALRAPLFSSLSTRRRRPHTQPPRQQSSGD